MKSTGWAALKQMMCWSGSDAVTRIGGCQSHRRDDVALLLGGRASSCRREEWGSLIDQDWSQPWPSRWVCQHWSVHGDIGSPLWTLGARFPAVDRESPVFFHREEKALLISLSFAGSDVVTTWTILGPADGHDGHCFITKRFGLPRVLLITLC